MVKIPVLLGWAAGYYLLSGGVATVIFFTVFLALMLVVDLV